VYYPSEDDGEGQPLNRRITELGRIPIVFMAHGNHGTYHNPADRLDEWGRLCGSNESPPDGWLPIPNYKGYDYFQQDLAKMGIIAVSVDCNATNCRGGGPSNIEERADLILASIDFFRSLDSDTASIFYQHIDFQSIALMGHSRGGDAVVLVPEVNSIPNTKIKAVIALAPTSFGPSSGQPKNYAFGTILPAGDGDVWSNDGAKFYDRAIPGPYKSQLYVHYTNHNFFNRQWLHDDGDGPPVMSRYDHERVLSVYGCAFYRSILLGHKDAAKFLSGHKLPAAVAANIVHLSFEVEDPYLTVDNHEDGNGIALNSLSLPTTQAGGLSADEYPFRRPPGAFNSSFFGNSTGMVATPKRVNGTFRSQIPEKTDLSECEVWIRAAEVYNEHDVPAGATGFELGLEDNRGIVVWIDSDGIGGGVPRPYNRGSGYTKTMLKTLRFPGSCFVSANPQFEISAIRAILIRCNRSDERALAFDDLQIVQMVK
jgi:dienelactone hydrolase